MRLATLDAFGAVGDGVTDDTAAIQRAFDAGGLITVPSRRVYRHTDVVSLTVPGSHLTGPGTLLATNEERSAVRVAADNVVLDNIRFQMGPTTKRWDAYEQMKLRINGHTGLVVRGVIIDGSACAGIFIEGADHYLIDNVLVRNTRADAIHNTGRCHDGVIRTPYVMNSGDDGVAVVSYANDKTPCTNISVISPRIMGTAWGRGLSVVGGDHVTFQDIYVAGSSSAAVYVSTEGNFNTLNTTNVLVDGGTIDGANHNATVDHGAVTIFNGQTNGVIDNITLQDLRIRNTRSTASDQVRLVHYGNPVAKNVKLLRFSIIGGSSNLCGGDTPATAYTRQGWTHNGFVVPGT